MRYLFFIFILVFLLSLLSYVLLRGWQSLQPAGNARVYYLIISISLFVSMIGSMIFGNYLPATLAKYLSFAGLSYFIVMIYLMFSFLLVDIVRLTNHFVHFAPAGLITFRYWAMLFSLLVIGTVMAVGNYKFNHPATVQLDLEINKPTTNKVIKIVAVSDIHLGISIDKSRLKKYVELINSQHPDIVLIAGDLSDRGVKPLIDQKMNEELSEIKAPLGVFAITGNHDFYAESLHAATDYIRQSGITVLQDSAFLVNNEFYIVGRDDKTNHKRKSLSEIIKNIDKSKPVILLDHQPFHLEEAEQNGIDLQISGHTHNGQFFPGSWFVKRMFEVGYGYLKKGNTHYYVSSGLGLWGPQYRIGTQSEVVVIDLKY